MSNEGMGEVKSFGQVSAERKVAAEVWRFRADEWGVLNTLFLTCPKRVSTRSLCGHV